MFKQDGDFEKLCLILNYQFRNKALLAQALTTKAASQQASKKIASHHEEMAFFGDGILRMVVDKVLMDEFPYYSVGELSKTRDLLVKNINLGEAAKRLKLETFIRMNPQQTKACEVGTPKLLADTVEAIIYAIYKDSNENLTEVKNFIFSHSTISQFLKQEQARITGNYQAILMEITQGNVTEVQKLLAAGCPTNFKFSWTDFYYDDDPEDPRQIGEDTLVTPLERALDCMHCHEGYSENETPANYLKIIQLLLEHAANLNLIPDLPEKLFPQSLHIRDHNNKFFSFIQYQRWGRNPENLQSYLAYRNLLLTQKIASVWEKFLNQVIEIFYRCGIFLDGEDYQFNNTILQLAIIHGQSSTIDLLLQYKINPNIQNKFGETALHLAVLFADQTLIRQLLDAGANDQIRNENGLKPFDLALSPPVPNIIPQAKFLNAVQAENNRLIRKLSSAGKIAVDYTFETQEPILIYILREYLNAIYTKNILIDRYNKMGVIGRIDRFEKLFKLLLKAGANPNQRDTQGKTALHVAVITIDQYQLFEHNTWFDHPIVLLLEHGANPALRDKDNNFASHYTHDSNTRRILINALTKPVLTAAAAASSSTASSSGATSAPKAKCKFFQPQTPNSCDKGNQCQFSHGL